VRAERALLREFGLQALDRREVTGAGAAERGELLAAVPELSLSLLARCSDPRDLLPQRGEADCGAFEAPDEDSGLLVQLPLLLVCLLGGGLRARCESHARELVQQFDEPAPGDDGEPDLARKCGLDGGEPLLGWLRDRDERCLLLVKANRAGCELRGPVRVEQREGALVGRRGAPI